MKNKYWIGPVFFLVIIVILGGVVWYNNMSKQKELASMCYESGGEYDDICHCGELFPIYNTEIHKCENMNGRSPSNRESYKGEGKRFNFANYCSSNSKSIYVVPNTPFTFCYDNLEVAPKITQEDGEKDTYSIGLFKNNIMKAGVEYVHIDNDEYIQKFIPSCTNCNNLSQDRSSIEEQLGLEDGSIEMVTSTYKDTYKIDVGSKVVYFIPFIDDVHHVVVHSCADESVCSDILTYSWIDSLLIK